MKLADYNLVLVNTSGGKDSQTMMGYVVGLAQEQGYDLANVVAVHADLGRVEWEGTRELAAEQARQYGLRFEAVKRPQGDLLDHVEQRGMWPSSAARYCTSDHKRGQVMRVVTALHREMGNGGTFRVLNCLGFRAEESPARAKRQAFSRNHRLSTQSRIVDDWLPIHTWTAEQVWEFLRRSGVPSHPAYDLGMPRLSCVFCVFAPKAALIIAGKHNRALLDEYAAVEERIGHNFRKDTPIRDIRDAVAAGVDQDTTDLASNWNM